MREHTPGPWQASDKSECGPDADWGVFTRDGGQICYVGDPYPRGDNHPYENMVLIAAAPDLFAAAKSALAYMSHVKGWSTHGPSDLSAEEIHKQLVAAIEKASAKE